jgi:hypothetical protein
MYAGDYKCIHNLVRRTEGKISLLRLMYSSEDNTEKQEVRVLIWIHVSHSRIQWCVYVKTLMNLQVLHMEFLHTVLDSSPHMVAE